MHGEQLREKAFRRVALGRLGLDPKTRVSTGADLRGMMEQTNIDLLPPDMTMPITQLDSGRPVFVLGISALDGPDWIL